MEHNIFDAKPVERSQKAMSDIFSKDYSKAAQAKADEKYYVSRQLALVCAIDFEPFSLVERKGFKKLCDWYNIKNLPTPQNLSDTALIDVYNFFKKKTIEILKDCEHIAITLDCWTDGHKKRAFIVFRVHFNKEFKLGVVTLKTEFFPHPHTAQNIQKKILSTLEEFSLSEKKILAVTDNGSNIVSGLQIAGIKRISCMAHNIHLFITKDIFANPDFNVLVIIVDKLKHIYKALTYKHEEMVQYAQINKQMQFMSLIENAIDIDELNNFDDQYHLNDENNHTSLKNSNATRWNSLLTMVKSFVKNYMNINTALMFIGKLDHLIQNEELNILKAFQEFLEIFESCTVVLQGQLYPTLSLNILFYNRIKKR